MSSALCTPMDPEPGLRYLRRPMEANTATVIFDQSDAQLAAHEDITTVRAVAWSPNGLLTVAGTWHSDLRVFDGGGEVFHGEGAQQRIQSVAVSPDGTWIASAGGGGIIRIWGVRPGRVSPE